MKNEKTILIESLQKLQNAGNDEERLGMALLKFHSALEACFRNRLCEMPGMPNSDLIATNKVQWQELADLAENYLGLNKNDKSYILKINTIRNKVAHGDAYTLTRQELQNYARFVQDFIESPTLSNQIAINDDEIPVYIPHPVSHGISQPVSMKPTTQPIAPTHFSVSPPITISPPRNLPAPRRSRSPWRALGCYFVAILIMTCLSILAFKYYSVWTQFSSFDDGAGNSEEESTPILGEDGNDHAVSATPDVIRNANPEDDQDNARTIESSPSTQNSDPVGAQPPPTNQIRVLNNSNVRESPDSEALIMGVAVGGDVYDVIEVNAEKTWYKIRLANGQEGWIGSSRVEIVSP